MIFMQILIIHTGGTIGMVGGSDGLAPDPEFTNKIVRWIESNTADRPDIVTLDRLIDSADAAPEHWQTIANRILRLHAEYKGVVVLHGTDTLAYTASALSFLLRGLGKPIVLTGSQIPFYANNSDAAENLTGALACANDRRIREVCILFDGQFLRGNRSVKFSTQVGDSFCSPHCSPLAHFDQAISLNEPALLRPTGGTYPSATNVSGQSVGLVKIYPGFSDRILLATAEAHPAGIVLELYGSATAPTLNVSFPDALTSLSLQRIPLVGVSQCMRGAVSRPAYVSSHILRGLGVIAGHDLTPEAAVTKLAYVRSLGREFPDLAKQISTDFAGEITARPS